MTFVFFMAFIFDINSFFLLIYQLPMCIHSCNVLLQILFERCL